jgi:hypothetical protein
MAVGTISRKTSGSTDESNGQSPLDIAVENTPGLLRGQNFEHWPCGDPRAKEHLKKKKAGVGRLFLRGIAFFWACFMKRYCASF